MGISGLDFGLIGAYLLGTVLFGVWIGRGQRSAGDYMLGSRDLPAWAVLLSIVATETSTVTFLSAPGAAYEGNLTFLQLPLGYILGRVAVVLVLMPGYFRGQYFTAYQVLQERFGGTTKQVASLLFLVTRSLADGLRLTLTAIVLHRLTGWGMVPSILAMGAVTVVYTYFGGMKAVVWTDVSQFFVYLAGAVAAFAVLLGKLPGGWQELIDSAGEAGKLRMFEFAFEADRAYGFWAGLVGGAFLSFASHGADQLMVQRYLCARSQRGAAWALLLSGPVVFVQFTLFLFLGLGLYAFYRGQPALPGDQVFARFIVDHLRQPPGLLGLVVGAVFAAALSTLSSSLNSSATTAVKDLYLPWFRPDASEREQLVLTKTLTALFGGVQMLVAIAGIYQERSILDRVLEIAGFTTGPILGLFLLGRCTAHVRQPAALAGLLVAIATLCTVRFVLPEWTGWRLAWPWYPALGAFTTVAAGLAAATLRPRHP